MGKLSHKKLLQIKTLYYHRVANKSRLDIKETAYQSNHYANQGTNHYANTYKFIVVVEWHCMMALTGTPHMQSPDILET